MCIMFASDNKNRTSNDGKHGFKIFVAEDFILNLKITNFEAVVESLIIITRIY